MEMIVAIVLGATFGALGRHHQGGASHRWIGVALYTPIILWVGWSLHPYPFEVDQIDWFIRLGQMISLIGGWYGWILMRERFGNLWHSTWRYGGPILFACLVTQFWWALPMMLPAWFLVKWAKEDHGYDTHCLEEFGLGGIYGAVWTACVATY